MCESVADTEAGPEGPDSGPLFITG